jgi:hypothetical protein
MIDGRYAGRYDNTRQARAVIECPYVDGRKVQIIRQGNTRQTGAALKRIPVDGRNTVGYDYARQTGVTKRQTTDARYTVGYDNTRQAVAVPERIIGYVGNGCIG